MTLHTVLLLFVFHVKSGCRDPALWSFHVKSGGGDPALCKINDDDDDVELDVLGCRVDILGTNCNQCVRAVQCCFTSTETVRLIRTGGAQDGHLNFHTAPEL